MHLAPGVAISCVIFVVGDQRSKYDQFSQHSQSEIWFLSFVRCFVTFLSYVRCEWRRWLSSWNCQPICRLFRRPEAKSCVCDRNVDHLRLWNLCILFWYIHFTLRKNTPIELCEICTFVCIIYKFIIWRPLDPKFAMSLVHALGGEFSWIRQIEDQGYFFVQVLSNSRACTLSKTKMR